MNLQSLQPWDFVGQTLSSRLKKRLDNIHGQKVCEGLGRDVPLIPSGEAVGVWENKVTDFREEAQLLNVSLEALSDTACRLSQTFPTFLQGPQAPHTSLLGWLSEQEPAAPGGQPDTTHGTCRAQKLWSSASAPSSGKIHSPKHRVEDTAEETCLRVVITLPRFLLHILQSLAPLQSWGVSPAVSPGNLGVWTRTTPAPPHAMGEGNKSPHPCQFLCQLDVLHV